VAVLAHPLSLGLDARALGTFVRRLARAGFGGIEAMYAGYTPGERETLAELAREVGLVPTGGSDFHGAFKPDLQVGSGRGDLDVPDWVLDELMDRRP
jgi:predicted metal-dependent phosphoesterase TrpH